jgi:hypothetical protein
MSFPVVRVGVELHFRDTVGGAALEDRLHVVRRVEILLVHLVDSGRCTVHDHVHSIYLVFKKSFNVHTVLSKLFETVLVRGVEISSVEEAFLAQLHSEPLSCRDI